MARSNDRFIGKRLDGRYEIQYHIGEGGMADVYMGRDVLDDRTVAVKILKDEYAGNEEFLRRFRNESKATAVLNHPNIVGIYDVGFGERLSYIVMEYIDGITLREYIDSEKMIPWRDAAHFIKQILSALDHAHSRGIVHRDIKPQNIMMLTDGTIKVMDFGIAKFARDQGQTATDQAIGTVHYISPEQARGEATDEKSDIYSVGCMMYEMMTGKKPFDGDNPVAIAVMHMQSVAPRPRSINPSIPKSFEEIIIKAMEKTPEDRYHSAKEMIEDIERAENDPAINFGYQRQRAEEAEREAERKPVRPASPPPAYPVYERGDRRRERTAVRTRSEYIEEDIEEQTDNQRSLFVPVLLAVTIVVVIVAIFFVATLFQKVLSGESINGTMKMSNLVGMDYDDAVKAYPDLNFNIAETDYTTYEENVIYEQDIAAGETVKSGDTVNVGVSLGVKTVTITDVTDWDYKKAKSTLEGLGLSVEIRYSTNDSIEKDHVISSDPVGGTEVALNSNVILSVSKGVPDGSITVPDFVGMTIEKAEEQARYLGLEVEKEAVDSEEPENTVISQDIEANSSAESGSTIFFEYSSGEAPEESEATGSVVYRMPIPTNATGTFSLDFTVNGVSIATTRFSATAGVTDIEQEITGSGSQTVIVILTNETTGANTQLGSYTFDFTSMNFSTITEDINAAFERVGGLTDYNEEPAQEEQQYYNDTPQYIE